MKISYLARLDWAQQRVAECQEDLDRDIEAGRDRGFQRALGEAQMWLREVIAEGPDRQPVGSAPS
jgi:hypothetical protein